MIILSIRVSDMANFLAVICPWLFTVPFYTGYLYVWLIVILVYITFSLNSVILTSRHYMSHANICSFSQCWFFKYYTMDGNICKWRYL